MTDERIQTGGPEAPAAGEVIHLPGPTYLPVATAAGVTLAVVGVVLSWILVALGGVVTLAALWRWIRESRQDMAELPLQHRH
jgi:Flp pilus assembly protein TadB